MGSNRVGSVFLGDIQRHRHLSSPTHSNSPPSSPPPTTGAGNSIAGVFSFNAHPLAVASEETDSIDMDSDDGPHSAGEKQSQDNGVEATSRRGPGKVDPILALELRLRWLEALILGMKQQDQAGLLGKGKKGKSREEFSSVAGLNRGETLTRLAENVQAGLEKVVEGNEGLRKFMKSYDQHAELLTPSFALSGILPDPPTYEQMTPEEINALLAEMEPDIRAADRDMLEIDALEKKGVTGAGRLPDYEKLEPRLKALVEAYEEDTKVAESLEVRISSLVDRHATYADTLSELFVAWDETLADAEDRLTILEREKAERLRLGFE